MYFESDLNIIMTITKLFIFICRARREKRQENSLYIGSPCGDDPHSDADKRPIGIVRTSDYGYAHVWELQHLKNTPDVLDTESRDGKTQRQINLDGQKNYDVAFKILQPGNSMNRARDFTYESPKFKVGDEIVGVLPEEVPHYHEFDSQDAAQGPHASATPVFRGVECRECMHISSEGLQT